MRSTSFYLQDSTISIEHFRFIMQSLPKGDLSKQGKTFDLSCEKNIKFNSLFTC